MSKFFLLFCGVLMSATVAGQSMPNVRPVPGSGAAYLYFPGESEGRVKLTITKEFGNMVQDRYTVYYRAGSRREEVICKETEEICEKLVPAGRGRLRIEGYYDPAKKLPITHAKFNGACSTTGKQCTVNLRTSGAESVRITTGCNGSDYSVIELSGKDSALCIGPGIGDKNSYLIAAHKNIALKRVKTQEKVGFKDATDGKANTKIMLDNWNGSVASTRESAAHHCSNLKLGENKTKFNGWYVPAIKELDLVLSGWDNKDQSFIIPRDSDGYYSSTETGSSSTETYRWRNGKDKNWLGYNSAGSVICVYSVGM